MTEEERDDLRDRLTMALADPQAPWYGSDLITYVMDYVEAIEFAMDAIEDERDILRDLVPHMWCPECEMDCTSAGEDGCCSSCGVDPISHDAKIRTEVAEQIAVELEGERSFDDVTEDDRAEMARRIGAQSSGSDALTPEQHYGLAVAKEHASRSGGAK